MSDRLTILNHQLNIHLEAAMSVIMEIRNEANKIQQPVVRKSGLTDEQIAFALSERERRKRKHKSHL